MSVDGSVAEASSAIASPAVSRRLGTINCARLLLLAGTSVLTIATLSAFHITSTTTTTHGAHPAASPTLLLSQQSPALHLVAAQMPTPRGTAPCTTGFSCTHRGKRATTPSSCAAADLERWSSCRPRISRCTFPRSSPAWTSRTCTFGGSRWGCSVRPTAPSMEPCAISVPSVLCARGALTSRRQRHRRAKHQQDAPSHSQRGAHATMPSNGAPSLCHRSRQIVWSRTRSSRTSMRLCSASATPTSRCGCACCRPSRGSTATDRPPRWRRTRTRSPRRWTTRTPPCAGVRLGGPAHTRPVNPA